MEDNDTNGYGEHKSVEPQAQSKGKITNADKQKSYRNRLKAKVGDKTFKQEQAIKMKAYRKQRAEASNVDEIQIPHKQTRDMVNQLLKTIEQRVVTMIQEQKANPAIPIYFENHIKPVEIERVLVNITNDMDDDVFDFFRLSDSFEELDNS